MTSKRQQNNKYNENSPTKKIKTDDNNLEITIHSLSKPFQCICEKEYSFENVHLCKIRENYKNLLLKPCSDEDTNYKDCKDCHKIFLNEKHFDDHWFTDHDGYTRCQRCQDKCSAYVYHEECWSSSDSDSNSNSDSDDE